MTSKAERKARSRANAQRRGEENAKKRGDQPVLKVVAENPKLRDKTGLEWLHQKKRLTAKQLTAGKTYGLDFRLASVDGMEPLRSCLNDEPRGGDGIGGFAWAANEMQAKHRLEKARDALYEHEGMVNACDLVCGRGYTPWEVIDRTGGTQRDVERLQNTLVIALDILAKHYSRPQDAVAT